MLASSENHFDAAAPVRPDSHREPGRVAFCGAMADQRPHGGPMQTVRNAEGELVKVLDAADFEEHYTAIRRGVTQFIGWLGVGFFALLVSGAIYVVRASDRAERTEKVLATHIDSHDTNLNALLRMTDSLRIEMRHLTNAIERGAAK